MRKCLSLVVALSMALTLGACQEQPTELTQRSNLEAATQPPAAVQTTQASQGAILFDWPFLAGFVIPDLETGNVCVVTMSELDINDFGVVQPNGHRQVHLQDRAADFFVFTETEPDLASGGDVVTNLGEADLKGEGEFNSSAVLSTTRQVLLNLSVNAAGTVGDDRHVVCKAQFNSQGAISSDVQLQ